MQNMEVLPNQISTELPQVQNEPFGYRRLISSTQTVN